MASAEWSYTMKNDSKTFTPVTGQREYVKFGEEPSEAAIDFGKGLDDALAIITRQEGRPSPLVAQDTVTGDIPVIDPKRQIVLCPLSSSPSDLQNIFDSTGGQPISSIYELTAPSNPDIGQIYSTNNTNNSDSILASPMTSSSSSSELICVKQESETDVYSGDTDDKRRRNREAAQNSRFKKQQKSLQLNEQVKKLKKDNEDLEKQYQELEKSLCQIKLEFDKHSKN